MAKNQLSKVIRGQKEYKILSPNKLIYFAVVFNNKRST